MGTCWYLVDAEAKVALAMDKPGGWLTIADDWTALTLADVAEAWTDLVECRRDEGAKVDPYERALYERLPTFLHHHHRAKLTSEYHDPPQWLTEEYKPAPGWVLVDAADAPAAGSRWIPWADWLAVVEATDNDGEG